uniref:Synaptobrevin, longin-like domain protein n=1 Tax=Tanacetum cinerariifolium TaxID=118510 RepID=A0A699HAV2_TANCI|nr:hypothetical protein [Tanacetum cinerariifolium]
MANLEFVAQHNMVTCLEKTKGNSKFHEIIYFLTSSAIHHALIASLTIYISYIEQFWNTATSQTLNDEKQIHATIDSKAVVVTEASIRSSHLFYDADGTACLTNEAIFQNLALMGYEGELNKLTFQKALFSPQWKYLIHTILYFLSSKSTSWNALSINIASAVICGYASNRDEGALNLEELFSISTNLSNGLLDLETVKDTQAIEIIAVKAMIKKLEKKCKPSISHHRAWLKSVQSTLDDLDADHSMDTEEPMNQRRLSKEIEELVSTARPGDSTVRPDVGTVDPIVPLLKTSIFDDEEITMAQTLIKMKKDKAKEKRVSIKDIKDIKDTSRPVRSLLTLKPLPTIDPKEEGKGIEANALFAAKLQPKEREEYTIKERAKFLAEIIAAQRKFRAAQRSAEIRSRPPTKSQLRNLMMTYLKNMGGYKYSQLKAKTFTEIQGFYERQKRVIDDFKHMDSDDAVDKEKVLEELDNTMIEVKQEGDEKNIRKRIGIRLKMKGTKKSKRKKTDFDLKEEEHLKTFL